MLPPPSPNLGRGHSIIILLMVDRGTDNWCQPPFALVYVFSTRRCLSSSDREPPGGARPIDSSSTTRYLYEAPDRSAPESFLGYSTPGPAGPIRRVSSAPP